MSQLSRSQSGMKRLLLGIVSMALSVTLAACGSSDAGSSGASGAIEIGSFSPLSGPQAATGIRSSAGVRAAVEEINAAGGINGRKISLTALDSAWDPQQAIQAARKLIGEKKVVAIVAAQGTASIAATFPYVLDQSKVPIVFPYGGLATWYTPPKAGLFGAQTIYEDQGEVLGQWAAERGAKNVVIVHNDPTFTIPITDMVVAGARAKNPDVQFSKVSVKLNTTDYSPIVAQVKRKSPDAVVLIVTPPEAAAYLKQAKLQGITAPAYGFSPIADETVLQLAGEAAEGFRAVSATKVPTDTDDPAVAGYVAALKKYAPDQEPNFWSIYTYAGTKAFVEILKGIEGDITSESITKAVESSGSIDTGLLPTLTFDADKHLGTNQVLPVVVKGGTFKADGEFTAAS